jgi:hypothetical protein
VVEHADVLKIGEKEDGQEVTTVGDQKFEITKGARESTIKSGDKLTVTAGDIAVEVSSGRRPTRLRSIELGSAADDRFELDHAHRGRQHGQDRQHRRRLKGMMIKAEGRSAPRSRHDDLDLRRRMLKTRAASR